MVSFATGGCPDLDLWLEVGGLVAMVQVVLGCPLHLNLVLVASEHLSCWVFSPTLESRVLCPQVLHKVCRPSTDSRSGLRSVLAYPLYRSGSGSILTPHKVQRTWIEAWVLAYSPPLVQHKDEISYLKEWGCSPSSCRIGHLLLPEPVVHPLQALLSVNHIV